MGSGVWRRMQWIIALVVLFLIFSPRVCMASTPPVQPSLLLEIPNSSPAQNARLELSVSWNGYVSYNKPPEQIIVHVFFIPDGSRLGNVFPFQDWTVYAHQKAPVYTAWHSKLRIFPRVHSC